MADPSLGKFDRMHPIRWVPPGTVSLLDVGCNVGAFLMHCHEAFPGIRLAGVEVNVEALDAARRNVPGADLHPTAAETLPFPDESFDCVTCVEVLEHIPADFRVRALAEMRRVLKRGGRLVLRVPHAGAFAFLDSNNLRFRLPWLYRRLIRRGLRDATYETLSSGVVWHHHFTKRELLSLTREGWEVEAWRRGGLLLVPLMDIARWPFYRANRGEHPINRAMGRLAALDLGLDYGPLSFDVLIVLRRL